VIPPAATEQAISDLRRDSGEVSDTSRVSQNPNPRIPLWLVRSTGSLDWGFELVRARCSTCVVSAFLLSSSSSHFVGGERATDLHAGDSVLPRGIVTQECSFPGICDLCTIGDMGFGIWDLEFSIRNLPPS
jgi:hypothetical protein